MTMFHVTVSTPFGYLIWMLQFSATAIGGVAMLCGGAFLACHVIDWATNRIAITLGVHREIVEWIYHKYKVQRDQKNRELAQKAELE